MKLKKIASLALAGVMAVSMLAGCKSNNSGSTGDQGNTVVETTGIAKELNDVQIAGSDVQINFTSDSTLDAYFAKAVKTSGQFANVDPTALQQVGKLLMEYSGIVVPTTNVDATTGSFSFTKAASTFMKANADCQDGKTVTYAAIASVDSNSYTTDDAAVYYFVNQLNDSVIKTLQKDTYDESKGMGIGSTYYELGYTGKASMAKFTDANGIVHYYFAVMIEQTATETTKK